MDTYIGVALNGASMTVGEMDANGNILRLKHYQAGCFSQEAVLELILSSLEDYRLHEGYVGTPCAIGVGLIGRVDGERGIWHQIDPARTQAIDVMHRVEAAEGLPCFIDNDVKASARAVQRWGFGQTSQNLIYLYVGTGIAASIIVEGRQIRGSHFNAGEVGHMRVGVSVGAKCLCGRTDCVEAIASGIGIDSCARLLRSQYATRLHIPSDDERVSVEEVFRLSREGDPLCVVLVENAVAALADLIMNLVRVSDPEIVVLGGEMVADGFLLEKIQRRLHDVTMRFVTNGVVITKLNPRFISLLGAGALAIDGMEELLNEEE